MNRRRHLRLIPGDGGNTARDERRVAEQLYGTSARRDRVENRVVYLRRPERPQPTPPTRPRSLMVRLGEYRSDDPQRDLEALERIDIREEDEAYAFERADRQADYTPANALSLPSRVPSSASGTTDREPQPSGSRTGTGRGGTTPAAPQPVSDWPCTTCRHAGCRTPVKGQPCEHCRADIALWEQDPPDDRSAA